MVAMLVSGSVHGGQKQACDQRQVEKQHLQAEQATGGAQGALRERRSFPTKGRPGVERPYEERRHDAQAPGNGEEEGKAAILAGHSA
ncbi:MAG: hypothetical protein OWU84_08235 [Firmicutes bacterium]|nr:hypothetical protein [Bacillota bacterium]